MKRYTFIFKINELYSSENYIYILHSYAQLFTVLYMAFYNKQARLVMYWQTKEMLAITLFTIAKVHSQP